jgi:hypothetical protein
MKTNMLAPTIIALVLAGCGGNAHNNPMGHAMDWKSTVKEQLPLLGHRNWILVVDKAFPAQTGDGMTIINTDADLLDVLKFTLQQIDSSTHVSPIVYCDKELEYITSKQVGNIDAYRTSLRQTIGKVEPQVILHDTVFVKIKEASKLFKTLVLKTNETIPYSSVFLQLDCKYWSGEKEKELRESMTKSR